METLVLTGIGIAALGYLARMVYRGVRGETTCNCGGNSSCGSKSKNGDCCSRLPK